MSEFASHTLNLNAPCTVADNLDIRDETKDDISYVMNKSPANNAAGHDAIPSRILKANIHVLCSPLCHISYHAFSSKSNTNMLKIAKVIPVHKSADLNLPRQLQTDMCPEIYQNHNCTKKMISSQLKQFLRNRSVRWLQQRGFVANRSASTVVLMLSQHTYSTMQENYIVIGVFLDVRNAFDEVSNSILL